MKIREQYEVLQTLKKELNDQLQDLDFHNITELLRWSAHSAEFQKLKTKDNQLMMLDFFYRVWLREKKQLEKLEIHDDIFIHIDSLDAVEVKYLMMQFGVYRLEMNVPETYQQQFVDSIIEERISGIALYSIIRRESQMQKENVLKLARLLKAKGQLVVAITLLREAGETSEKDADILLELADCWLTGEQWQAAYDCLCEIEHPDSEVQGLIRDLKGMLHEDIQ